MGQPNERQTALITGASSGIGEELAKVFASQGYNLVLVARNEQKLQQLADALARDHQVQARALPMDLADRTAPDRIRATLENERISIDVLVNNAGFGQRGPFAEMDLRTELDMLEVNVTALTALTRLFLPGMVARRHGGVLNVASTAAYVPGPFMAVYYASKAYVLSLSVALANELAGAGIRVTALCPGPTRTDFVARANIGDSNLFRRGGVMEPAEVARAGYQGLMRGKAVVIAGARNRWTVAFAGLVPRTVLARIARRLNASA